VKPDDWALVQRLFGALCDLPVERRRQELASADVSEQVRAQVAELLEFDRGLDVDRLAEGVAELSRLLSESDLSGQRLGPWRLLSPLGEGGMGEVYRAERADGRYEATVAVKFLALSGPRAQRLFERERRILARLVHPGIARLLDAGEHERLGAYLVMEYVDGEPLDRFAARKDCDPIDTIGQLRRAAEAVAHAHQNLVLHRDLKPEHLIVTPSGELKILDFGVAALVEDPDGQAEQTGLSSFTPRYAAPEQILRQATTTRTDVYALGQILHEVLAGGESPFGQDGERLIRRKLAGRADRLPALCGLSARQQRDAQAVIGRCLESDPARRYASAGELAEELCRLEADRPVSARRPGLFEQLRRASSQHRLAASALLVAVLAIFIGSAASVRFALDARSERNMALAEAEKARQVTAFLESLFQSSTPGIERGPETTVREVLDRGRERIVSELSGQPDVAAQLERAIANSYIALGLHDEALALLADVRVDESGPSRGQRRLLAAKALLNKNEFERALEQLEDIEALMTDPLDLASAALTRSVAELNLDRVDASVESAHRAISLSGESERGLSIRLAAQNMIAVAAYNRGEYAAALKEFTELYELERQRHGEIHHRTRLALSNMGNASLALGDPYAAAGYYERALEVAERYFGVDNQAVAHTAYRLGLTRRRLGDGHGAEVALRRALAAYEAFGGRDRYYWHTAAVELVELLVLTGRDEDAAVVLIDLPRVEGDSRIGYRSVLCRLEKLKAALDLPGDHCTMEEISGESARAVAHYLDARRLKQGGQPAYREQARLAAELESALTVRDPLLAAAVESL